jgi:hypothetical protein
LAFHESRDLNIRRFAGWEHERRQLLRIADVVDCNPESAPVKILDLDPPGIRHAV